MQQQLYNMCWDRNKSPDDIANVLLGLQTLYDDRFSQFMEVCLSHQPEKMCRAYIDLIR